MPAVNLCLFSFVSMSRMHEVKVLFIYIVDWKASVYSYRFFCSACTLITHVLIMLSLVFVLICFLCHTVLNPAITPVARVILLLISLWQLLCQVGRLPRYTNSVTFSIHVFPINSSSSIASCPNTIVMVFLMLILSPAASPASLICFRFSCILLLSTSDKSISSANLRLLILWPCTDTPGVCLASSVG